MFSAQGILHEGRKIFTPTGETGILARHWCSGSSKFGTGHPEPINLGKTMTMTDEKLAGQRLMAGFDGTGLNRDLKWLIGTLKVGGIILFSRNIESPKQLSGLCQSVQAYAAACGQPPLLIAIDQEGGAVARLKWPFTEFPARPPVTGRKEAEHLAGVMAWELAAMGINMNMAPVMDVAPKEMKSIMAGRAFSHDPHRVSELGCRLIEVFQRNSIMAVAKHFPGIGRTVIDSHEDLPFMDSAVDDLQCFDLIPFQAAVRQNAAGMMLSHILYRKIDPQWPASLSVRIAKDLLRERMGYRGLVITDDLDMGAIGKHYDMETCIRQILLADIDIVLICHRGPNIGIAHKEILRHMQEHKSLRQRCETAVRRILEMKRSYRI
ncbi:MAG: beta-N-acetylhexosaminidase [Desulfobacterales bacterium]